METMNYYTHSQVTLLNIEELAKTVGYRTKMHHGTNDDDLFVFFGEDNHMRWEWSKYKVEKLTLEEDARERINNLKPKSVLLFEYYPKWLSEVIQFMSVVLKKYGGMLDCTGDVDVMYTLENINDLLSGCP